MNHAHRALAWAAISPGRGRGASTLQLLGKELRLQRPVWILVAAAILGWGSLWTLLPREGQTMGDGLLAVGFFLSWMSVILIPLAIGANAVAPERALGVLGRQLSQPTSSKLQWRIKLLATFGLTALLSLATVVVLRSYLGALPVAMDLPDSYAFLALLPIFAATAIGVFASQRANSALRALGLTFLYWPLFWGVAGLFWGTGKIALIHLPSSVLESYLITGPVMLSDNWPISSELDFLWALAVPVLLALLLLRRPKEQEWAGFSLPRRGAQVLMLVLVLGVVQLFTLHRTEGRLEAESRIAEKRLAELGDPAIDQTLMQSVGFTEFSSRMKPILSEELWVRQGTFRAPPVRVSPSMRLAATWDWDNPSEDSFWWRLWAPYFPNLKFASQGSNPVPTWYAWKEGQPEFLRIFTLAGVYRKAQRRSLVERRMRQEVVLLAVDVVRRTEWTDATVGGELWRQVEASPIAWALPKIAQDITDRSLGIPLALQISPKVAAFRFQES